MCKMNAVYGLGAWEVAVHTDQPDLLRYLDEFYQRVRGAGQLRWTISAELKQPGASMKRDSFGVGYCTDEGQRELLIQAPSVLDLNVTTRKCVREVMVAHCEAQGYTMIHASAVAKSDRLVIFVGDKGSGKTTLALRAVLEHGYRYISNDHLIIHRDSPDGLVVTSLPTLIPVKVGTYLKMENLLPEPYDIEGTDVNLWREVSASEQSGQEVRVLYTYSRLGQDNPVAIRLARDAPFPSVTVVFPKYVPFGQPHRPIERLQSVWPELYEHVRFDWVSDPRLNQRCLPHPQESMDRFAADSPVLVQALTERAVAIDWRHAGDVAPLLDALSVKGPECWRSR